jgi:hypothetical protein
MNIIVSGFPHCGTTILQKIISDCNGVFAHRDNKNRLRERIIVPQYSPNRNCKNGEPKHFITKWPFALDLDDRHREYFKIFIVRNPLYVFSSLNKRNMNTKNTLQTELDKHTVEMYKKTLKLYDSIIEDNKNLKLLYRDLFLPTNLQRIEKALDIEFPTDIKNSQQTKVEFKNKPSNHFAYRMEQLSKPFQNMNHLSNLTLTNNQVSEIFECDFINKYFSEIYMMKPKITLMKKLEL